MVNIDLITGFLGAGKTTFIRKYGDFLKNKDITFAVIENEYGSKGIDSRILEAYGIATDELFGGCICCTLKVGFHDMILNLAEHYDRVIVEPSGVYDISQFFSVMNSPELKDKCTIGNVICIVDPDTIDLLDASSKAMLTNQIIGSGCVIFSMHDNADTNAVQCFKKRLEAELDIEDINALPYTNMDDIFKCSYGNTDIEPDISHTDIYLSTLIKPAACTVEEMKERLKKLLLTSDAGNIYRIKGVWNSYLINANRGYIDISPFKGDEGLNIIGTDLNRKEIKGILNNTGG